MIFGFFIVVGSLFRGYFDIFSGIVVRRYGFLVACFVWIDRFVKEGKLLSVGLGDFGISGV